MQPLQHVCNLTLRSAVLYLARCIAGMPREDPLCRAPLSAYGFAPAGRSISRCGVGSPRCASLGVTSLSMGGAIATALPLQTARRRGRVFAAQLRDGGCAQGQRTRRYQRGSKPFSRACPATRSRGCRARMRHGRSSARRSSASRPRRRQLRSAAARGYSRQGSDRSTM